jgi:pantothenate kinase type III
MEFSRFLELSMLLEPGRTPSSDKMVILTNALQTIDELKAEAHQVTESNEKLRETIKKLKVWKVIPACIFTVCGRFCSQIHRTFHQKNLFFLFPRRLGIT